MTACLTLSIPASHVGDLAKLFELESAGVIRRDLVTYFPDPPRYVVEVDSAEVSYLLDQLVIATETHGGQSFVEWMAANSDQISLPLAEGVF